MMANKSVDFGGMMANKLVDRLDLDKTLELLDRIRSNVPPVPNSGLPLLGKINCWIEGAIENIKFVKSTKPYDIYSMPLNGVVHNSHWWAFHNAAWGVYEAARAMLDEHMGCKDSARALLELALALYESNGEESPRMEGIRNMLKSI
jgi:hypothetical protein